MAGEITPASVQQFEEQLQQKLRELGRATAQWAYNQAEPPPEALPHDLQRGGGGFRRLNQKTPNRNVATLFGKITLWRCGYRSWQRDDGEPTIFPLEVELGLIGGATPALASLAGRYMAQGGATQQTVLDRLWEQHGLDWGVKKLREIIEDLSQRMDEARHAAQVQHVVKLLNQASDSRGSRRPVLVVGRDGTTLATRPHGFYEMATSATLSVYDRRGQRLGTVYLAYVPQLGQALMTDQLTALVQNVLAAWNGRLPRLCYVTDAGDHETNFYRVVLRRMRHPRTGERLEWHWIVDYYHASERITIMSEAFAGLSAREAAAWVTRMRQLLLKPGGVRRVLLSAAALRSRYGLRKSAAAQFQRAYHYLRQRTRFMRYAEFRRLHLPIGSGVTEAANKTLFAQRLKLSGMQWSKTGAQRVLNLRVILLSGIWDTTFLAGLNTIYKTHSCTTCCPSATPSLAAAA